MTLDDILEVEDTGDILGFTFPGTDILMWPIVRISVMRMVIDRALSMHGSLSSVGRGASGMKLAVLHCCLDGMLHSFRPLRHPARFLFFCSGVTNVWIDGTYVNRVSDHFASCYPADSLLIEDPADWRHRRPRRHARVAYHAPLSAVARLRGAVPVGPRDASALHSFITFVDSRLQSVLGVALTKDEHARLLRFVTQRCRSLRLELQLYGLLFRHLRPRLVFFEDGCYGRLAPIIRLARDMGVRTAELQHGFVSLSHEAYNLAPTLLASQAYARFLPEFFLAYGNWWAKRMRVPMETVVVGNPHYDAMRRQWCHGVSERVSILVLSNGLDFNVFLELATTLHAALGNRYRVILRPHPIERESVARKYPDRSVGVTIDYSDNLYGRLAQAYAVVGETSTGLFEAAGLAERVFSMTSPTTSFYLPDNPFESFANTGELVEKLRDTHSGRVAPELLGSIWAEGWNDQYRSFLSKHSLLPSDGQADFGRQQRKH